MSAEILNSDVNKILDYFLIADHELENKEGLLKNIDNELDLSDDFPITKKSNEDNTDENKADDEFVDVNEENNEESTKTKPEGSTEEKNADEEIQKSMDILSLDEKEKDKDGNLNFIFYYFI